MQSDLARTSSSVHGVSNTNMLERRQGMSAPEHALRTLHHAVAHLISERDNNQQLSLGANRQAIALLCKAAQELTRKDRRDTTRRYAISWIWDALGWTK